VLHIDLPYIDDIEHAKKPERLPVVFSRSEVKQILAHLDGVEHLIVSLLYGSGRRLMEGLRLRVKDLDFDYGQITIRDAKGKRSTAWRCWGIVIAPCGSNPLQRAKTASRAAS
jgi:integrase